MKIVVGYDGSKCADRAIRDLELAGIPDGSEVLVISVSEWFPLPPGVGGTEGLGLESEESGEIAQVLAQRAAEELKSLHPNWSISSEGYSGSPANELVHRAETWGAELMVVGSHGRGAMGRFLLGSVSQQILHSATHTSIRVARPDQERKEEESLRLILAVDGSSYSGSILDALLNRVWPEGTSVLIVSSAEFSYDSEEEQTLLTRLRNLHETIEERLLARGLKAESIIDTKMLHPKKFILTEAEQMNADCIFMGARGLTGFERFILGSTSTGVAMQAKCSVEIVRPPSEPA